MRAGVRPGLAVGSALNGILAYAFFITATHALGPEAAAPVSVLWTYWSFAAAALTFPIQHWIAHSVALHEGESAVRAALRGLAVATLAVAASAGVAAFLLRDPLFHRSDAGFPALVAAVTLASGFVGVVRGGLAARARFTALGVSLAAENGVRWIGALVLIGVGADTSTSFGVCLAVGGLIGLAWPSAVAFRQTGREADREFPLAFLGGAAGGQVLGQVVLTGGPVALALGGGSPSQVTALFAALALFRAPYTLALGLLAQLTGALTTFLATGPNRFAHVRRALIAGAAAGTGLAAVVGAVAGPDLLPLVFGDEVRLSWRLSAVIAVGSAFALANLVATVAVIARGATGAIPRGWLVGLIAGAATFAALTPASALTATCCAFLAAEAATFAAIVWVSRR
jgi:O-antigen/teichoic acid export membrane protein